MKAAEQNEPRSDGAMPGATSAVGRFRVVRVEERVSPAILRVNGGGYVPGGNASGALATNPAGFAPPGRPRGGTRAETGPAMG